VVSRVWEATDLYNIFLGHKSPILESGHFFRVEGMWPSWQLHGA
jgi:hypothetical protein